MPSAIPDTHCIAEQLRVFVVNNLLAEGVALDVNTSLHSVGVDSTALLELLLFAERRFHVTLDDAQLTRANLGSIAAVAECVHRAAAE